MKEREEPRPYWVSFSFIAAPELHPYAIDLINQAMRECGKHATLDEVVKHCEFAVARDGGECLHRNDALFEHSEGDKNIFERMGI